MSRASVRGGHVTTRGGHMGRPRGSYHRAGQRTQAQTQPCLVCDEHVTPETMVFHLAHRHFQDKVNNLIGKISPPKYGNS